jgi:hypothetical protein
LEKFKAFDVFKTKHFLEGMDECDTAARVMDCGKNADALVLENMVASVDLVKVVWAN